MKKFLTQLWHYAGKHKYLLTVLGFLVIICFLDKNNLTVRLKNKYEISRLTSERDDYQRKCDSLWSELKSLETDGKSLEKIAREEYGMHEEGEEVFIVR